jgi:hypothetical protein
MANNSLANFSFPNHPTNSGTAWPTIRYSERCAGYSCGPNNFGSCGIDAVVRQLETAGVPEHVRMNRKRQTGRGADLGDHLVNAPRTERRTTLRREHKGRSRLLLALQPT